MRRSKMTNSANQEFYDEAKRIREKVLKYHPTFDFNKRANLSLESLMLLGENTSIAEQGGSLFFIENLLDERGCLSTYGQSVLNILTDEELDSGSESVHKIDKEKYAIGHGIYGHTGVWLNISKDDLNGIVNAIQDRESLFEADIKVNDLSVKWLGYDKNFYIASKIWKLQIKNYENFIKAVKKLEE